MNEQASAGSLRHTGMKQFERRGQVRTTFGRPCIMLSAAVDYYSLRDLRFGRRRLAL